ncbi:hypothetical protein [Brachybacterium nesterenkovii]|uniref:hypothetical protein n=1 Tax=Brachybacterium nesterenkovii TaxID=47847 RepID=UPI003219904A
MTDPYGSGRSGGGSWGQPAPQGGDQQGAWGQGIPQGQGAYAGGGYGAPGPYGGPGAYGAPPVKRRGMVRIILGILGMLLGTAGALLGLLPGFLLGAGGGLVASISDIPPEDITTISNGQSVSVPNDVIALVGSTDPTATCTASGADIESNSQSGGFAFEKDGRTYTAVTQVTSTNGSTATVTCTGSGEVAVAELGLDSALGGVAIGLLIFVGIPVLIGVLGLILLISGVIGRVRSGKGQ